MTEAFPDHNVWGRPDEDPVTKRYVEDTQGYGYKDVCRICFATVRDIFMEDHLHWHKIAASPMAHGMYVESMLRGSDDGQA